MKKFIFLFAINFLALSGFAQWNYDSQNIMYSSSNTVTIGSNTPQGNYEPTGRALELVSPIWTSLLLQSGTNQIWLWNSPSFGNSLSLPNNVPFTFKMSGITNPAMRIQTNGNIGINTTLNPTGYKLAVGGKIIAEELKVQLQSAPWPDYVFDSTYKLPTLKEVEQSIKDKGHLVNIPSATEVAANGFEVGEMNRLLLEKVEELTLYIIELNKKVDAQQQQIKAINANK